MGTIPQEPLRVGLIGLGAVGQGVLTLAPSAPCASIRVVGALVQRPDRVRGGGEVELVTSVDALLALQPDIVLEAGGHDALREHGPTVLRSGRDLLMVSVGALADPALEADIRDSARRGGCRARIVSGAIGGLDALASAAVGGLDRVVVTSRKPAHTLVSAEDLAGFMEAREIFNGTAREAALRFPESVNVAAAVSLAGLGFDRTQVCVVADPTIDRNRHEFIAEGAFGSMRVEMSNVPTTLNPKTARLVSMSAIHALCQHRAELEVG